MLSHMIKALSEMYPTVPICMHQDHGNNEATCFSAIKYGFTSVMMDGSLMSDMKTPSTYQYNVEITSRVTEISHNVGASVEGELGVLGSLETGEAGEEDGSGAEGKLNHDQLLTDPDQAADFVSKTKVDALAIACGTSHGAYKFSRPPTGDILAINRIKEIHSRLPNTHLVMHGSSSVPQDLIKTINEYGGKIKETYGVPVSEIQEGIKNGYFPEKLLKLNKKGVPYLAILMNFCIGMIFFLPFPGWQQMINFLVSCLPHAIETSYLLQKGI